MGDRRVPRARRRGGVSERFWSAGAAIELLPDPARWRAWALTDPEGWEIRLTTPVPGCEALLAAMGQGAFLGALEGVDGPHTSAIAEFQRPGEPPRCWVWDAERDGLTLPYRRQRVPDGLLSAGGRWRDRAFDRVQPG